MNNIEVLAFSEFVLNLCARMQFGLLPVNVDTRYHKVNEALYKFVSLVCKTNQMLEASAVAEELLESPFLWTESDFRFFLSKKCNTGLEEGVKTRVLDLQSLQQVPLNTVLVNTDGLLKVIVKDAEKFHENWLTVLRTVFTAVVVYNDFYVQHRSMIGCPVVLPHRFWELFGEIRSPRDEKDKAEVSNGSVDDAGVSGYQDTVGVVGFRLGKLEKLEKPKSGRMFGFSKRLLSQGSDETGVAGLDPVIQLLMWLYADENAAWYYNLGDDVLGDRRLNVDEVPAALQELLTELGLIKKHRLFKYVKRVPKQTSGTWQEGVELADKLAPIDDSRELHMNIIEEFKESDKSQKGESERIEDSAVKSELSIGTDPVQAGDGNVDRTSLFGS